MLDATCYMLMMITYVSGLIFSLFPFLSIFVGQMPRLLVYLSFHKQ
jgi:hypothetical protein